MMRRVASSILACLLLAAVWSPRIAAGERVNADNVPAVVGYVRDDGTVIVSVPSWPAVISPIQVRVAGLVLPKIHDPRPSVRAQAELARDWLASRLPPGISVVLRDVRRDGNCRLLAGIEAQIDGETRDVATEMVRRGLAKPYNGQGRAPW
ncbi:thermonuclease family protein [Desulfovibrio sp. JY]|nr:thermonuclease family protein [Desulfovibrio sp. JY]